MMLVNLSPEQVATIREALEMHSALLAQSRHAIWNQQRSAQYQAIQDALAALDTPAQQMPDEVKKAIYKALQYRVDDAIADLGHQYAHRIAQPYWDALDWLTASGGK